MDMFNLAQLTKHMVVKGIKDDREPYGVAEEAVRETLKTYLKGMIPGNPEVLLGVREVARGTMTGLLLCDVSLPRGAIVVLQAVGEIAAALPHDPTMLMTSTIEGIAELRLLLSLDVLGLIQAASMRSTWVPEKPSGRSWRRKGPATSI